MIHNIIKEYDNSEFNKTIPINDYIDGYGIGYLEKNNLHIKMNLNDIPVELLHFYFPQLNAIKWKNGYICDVYENLNTDIYKYLDDTIIFCNCIVHHDYIEIKLSSNFGNSPDINKKEIVLYISKKSDLGHNWFNGAIITDPDIFELSNDDLGKLGLIKGYIHGQNGHYYNYNEQLSFYQKSNVWTTYIMKL